MASIPTSTPLCPVPKVFMQMKIQLVEIIVGDAQGERNPLRGMGNSKMEYLKASIADASTCLTFEPRERVL